MIFAVKMEGKYYYAGFEIKIQNVMQSFYKVIKSPAHSLYLCVARVSVVSQYFS
jgi:hypothetical protein